MLAGLERRLDRAVIDDLDAHVAARDPRRNGDGDVARRDQADLVLAAELAPRVGDLLALGEERLRLPGADAPIHVPAAFVDPPAIAVEAGNDHEEAATVLPGRTGEAVTGRIGVAPLPPLGDGKLPDH